MNYILSRDNIATVSWGEIAYVLSKDETVILPQTTWKVSQKILWKKKHDWYLEAGDEYLKRTSFNAVLKMLTRSDQKVLSLQVIMYKLFW